MNEKINSSYENLTKEIYKSIEDYKFIYNDKTKGKEVLSSITLNLSGCDEFLFSVAFITDDGLAKLKLILKEIANKGIKGKIITTNYLNFTNPKALEDLEKMHNIEVRMYYVPSGKGNIGLHTKGYIFKKDDKYDIIIGSSNITQKALTLNKEWNQLVSSTKDSLIVKEVLNEFNEMWVNSKPINEIIEQYKIDYKNNLILRKKEDKCQILEKPKPNSMQIMHINNLNRLIFEGKTRALLISATGTGKTFASAFGIKYLNKSLLNVKKLLYVTHRENILKAALNTFNYVFENKIKCALFTGNNKDISDADFIFATTALIQKEEIYKKFPPNYFDFIIVDEAHRIGENKYQGLLSYFKTKFLLGMTATPDRTDGYNLYEFFDYNKTYEIRLRDALEANMLAPFNYFGISDIIVDGKPLDTLDINVLTCDERVKHIIEESTYYGASGKRIKCLMFVNSIEVGQIIAEKLNKLGFKSKFLDGRDSPEVREQAMNELSEDDIINKPYLTYLITVNIFNEGIDIPPVNQVILLRPTESSIVFIQQIGRGLRLYPDKDYINILDFIGNYENNYLIASAFNNGKENKDGDAKAVNSLLPGVSTIQFDEISRSLIYKSIDKALINSKRYIYEKYRNFKNSLGHIPSLSEIEKDSSIDTDVFSDSTIYSSYYKFLVEKKEIYSIFNENETKIINYLSIYIGRARRSIEARVLKTLLNNDFYDVSNLNKNKIESILSILDKGFATKNESANLIHLNNDKFYKTTYFEKLLNNDLFKKYLEMFIDFVLFKNKEFYNSEDEFVLYQRYTRRDVCQLINHTKNEEGTIFGYKLFKNLKVLPLFISYHKDPTNTSAIDYEDQFLDEEKLIWFSRKPRNLNSKEIIDILNLNDDLEGRFEVFIQKTSPSLSLEDEKSFTYFGKAKIINKTQTTTKNGKDVVKFLLKLETPVKEDIYSYFITPVE